LNICLTQRRKGANLKKPKGTSNIEHPSASQAKRCGQVEFPTSNYGTPSAF